MTDKKEEIIINEIDVTECVYRRQKPHNFCMCASVINESGNIIKLTRYVQCEYNPNCYFKQLAREKEEIKELRRYHNKCCKENTEKFKHWLEKYNRLSRDFYNGKYCNKENCSLLKAKEQECNKYKQALDEIENLCRNEACSPCKELEENDHCDECHNKIILDIINKAKEK